MTKQIQNKHPQSLQNIFALEQKTIDILEAGTPLWGVSGQVDRCRYPHLKDVDHLPQIWHIVTLNNGTEVPVYATEPGDAITALSKFLRLWNELSWHEKAAHLGVPQHAV